MIKSLHRKNAPALFIKLDITKDVDTVNWLYLLHIMEHLSFGQRWRNWVAVLWNSASSTFLLNGEP
jgi:hypothetical protein